jgi:peptidoglycan/LPS O-acetylase OafA/YrhL
MKHRADIDGLRAVAIIPVLLFHAGLPQVSGGFVGVDVFFVISGYLITGLILDDISKDRFSIAHFYERRVRRILPALFSVLICTAIAAYTLLMPNDATEFGKSLMATMFFSSNVLFWRQTDYFQAAAESKPLLHTWSLAVEEQFYILYPLFLFLISRYFRKRYALALLPFLVLSLLLSIWGVSSHRSATFYLAPARAWELLLGGLLAIQVIPLLRHRLMANILAVLGMSLLVYSFIALSAALPFPGANALYPVIGTALVVYTGVASDTVVSKVLSFKPIVWIGLISYSLYLWHWVLIVFFKYYTVRQITGLQIAALIGASILIAGTSWKFIENPFRGRRGLIRSRRLLFTAAGVGSMALACFGGLLYAKRGLPSRFNEQVLDLIASKGDYWNKRDACRNRICQVGNPKVAPSFLLWGDSHAGAIAPLFEQLAARKNVSGFVAFTAGCPPLLGLKRYDEDNVEKCARFGQSVLDYIRAERIGAVFLHGRWGLYSEGSRYKQEEGAPVFLTADRNPQEDYRELETRLCSTIEALEQLQVKVFLIASVPEVGLDVPTALARNALTRRNVALGPPYSDFLQRQERVFPLLSQIAEKYSVRVIYPHQVLCGGSYCSVLRDGHALYIDGHHLSVHGAMYLAPVFAPLLQ